MATSRAPKPLLVRGPFIGVNTTRNARGLSTREARDALNCDLDGSTIKCRSGFAAGATAPNGKPIEGMHDFRKPDGTRTHIVKAGDQLYKLSGSTFTAIGSGGLTEGNLAQFVTAGGKCYIAHGGIPKVTDGSTLDDWQIVPPGYAPDIAGVGTGLLTGTYDYKITFYASSWGLESPASPSTDQTDTAGGEAKTTVVDVARQWVELSNFPTSSDTRVDRLRIYRRKMSSYERDWWFLEEIPTTAEAWTDRTPDNGVELKTAPLSYTADYPKIRLLAANLGVLFGAGIDGDPSSVWYTRPGKTTFVDRLTLDDDGGEITALREHQGSLLILTSRSHWLLSGYDEQTFQLRKLIPDRGCIAPFSVVPVDNVVYSLSETAMREWNGAGVRDISWPVRDAWLGRNYARDYLIQGVHDSAGSAVWWTYSSAGSSTNDSILVYFYRNSQVAGALSWCPWEIAGACCLAQITDPSTNVRNVVVGFSDGRVATYRSAVDDNGVDVEWFWETGDEDLDTPTHKKEFGELTLETDGDADGVFDIEVSLDGSGVWDPLGAPTPIGQDFRHENVRRTGNQLGIRFRCEGVAEIVSWTLEADRSVRS